MFDSVLSWLVLVVPVVLGLIVILVPAKREDAKRHMRWRYILGASLILYGCITAWQQHRAIKASTKERDDAIKQTSAQVTRDVTKIVGDQYSEVVKNLTDQIGDLKGQLAKQSKDVNTIKGSDIVTGKKPINVNVVNPTSAPPPTAGESLPNVSWTQEQTASVDGKAVTLVTFRVGDYLRVPAFIAVCDRPCHAVSASASGVSQARPLNSSRENNLAGALYVLPRPMPPQTECWLRIASADSTPAKVTLFRILKETELPLGVK
jgi:hypothetical protein